MDVVARLRAAGCVFAEEEAGILAATASSPAELEDLVARRVAGEPLEVVVGWAELAGVRVAVEPGVFVPRRRSELLVREAVARARPGAVVVDLCCGTGAVGLAIAAAATDVVLHAADVDPAAVRCARGNVEPAGGAVHEGDLFDALPPSLLGRVDVLVANSPYVPTGELALLPAEARDHEPAVALDGGADGLDVQRRVAAGAARWLAPGGHLLVETGDHQADRTVALVEGGGLAVEVVRSARLAATVVAGRRPATA